MSAGKGKRTTRQSKQSKLTTFTETLHNSSENASTTCVNLVRPNGSPTDVCNMADSNPPPSTTTENSGNTSESVAGANTSNDDLKAILLNLDKKITDDIRSLKIELSEKIENISDKVQTITNRVETIESDNFDINNRLVKCEQASARFDELEDKIKNLENKLEYGEMRDRKYNVLIYGLKEVGQPHNENTELVVREFVSDTLKLGKDYSAKLVISNTHRLPRKLNSPTNDAPSAPPAIIVKLATMCSRNELLAAARNIPRETKVTVRTDLPPRLKEKRSILAGKAYEMRKGNRDIRTRIRESVPKRDVWLEYRNVAENTNWTKYND